MIDGLSIDRFIESSAQCVIHRTNGAMIESLNQCIDDDPMNRYCNDHIDD